jgi:hypothetical protein
MRVRENNSMASRYSSSATSPSASCARASAAAPQQRMPKPHARSDVQQPGVDRHLQCAEIQVQRVGRARQQHPVPDRIGGGHQQQPLRDPRQPAQPSGTDPRYSAERSGHRASRTRPRNPPRPIPVEPADFRAIPRGRVGARSHRGGLWPPMPAARGPTAHPARTTADRADPQADPPPPSSSGRQRPAPPARPAAAVPRIRAPERWPDAITAPRRRCTAAAGPRRPVPTGSAPPAPPETIPGAHLAPDPVPH